MKKVLAIMCAVCVLMTSLTVSFASYEEISGNILLNPGFEDAQDSTTPWTKANGISTEVKRNGNNSLKVAIGSDPDKCNQSVELRPDSTYLWSMWIKAEDADSMMTLWEKGDANLFDHNWVTVKNYNPSTVDGWTELRQIFSTPSSWTENKTYTMALLCNNAGTTVYVDDCYLGVLGVDSVQISGQNRVFVSATETITSSYTVRFLNQFGTTEGLGNKTVEWSISGEYDGVSINSQTGVLSILPTAEEGTVTIVATVDGVQNTFDVVLEKESLIPVTDTNLFSNGDFEDGETDWGGYTAVSETYAKNGAKSMYVSIGNAEQKIKQVVNLQKNKIYITAGYFLPETGSEEKTIQMYAESCSESPLPEYMNTETINATLSESEWKMAVRMYSTKEWDSGGDAEFGILGEDANVYVDDMYVGELVLADMIVSGENEILVSRSSTTSATYQAELLNQLHNGIGLTNETVVWSLDDEYKGVTINENTGELLITPEVNEGTIGVVVSCIPEFNTQGEVTDTFYVELTKEPLTVEEVKSNLLINGGFEDGVTGWSSLAGVSDTNVFEGVKSGKLAYGRTGSTKGTQVLNLEPNAVYIMSAYICGDEGENGKVLQIYAENRSSNPSLTSPSSDANYNKNATTAEGEWVKAIRVYKTDQWTESGDVSVGALSDNNLKCFIDDFYVGRLIIDSFDIRGSESIQIPSGGLVTKTTYTSTPLNQAGTTMGVGAERVQWELGEEYDGVSIDAETGILSVTSDAPAGVLKVRAVCYPSFNQDVLPKVYEDKLVTLTAGDDPAPTIKGLKISGTVEANKQLTASYRFYQKDGNEDCSEYRWYRANSQNEKYTLIEGATERTYTVSENETNCLFIVEVIPVDGAGNRNGGVKSEPAVKPTAPIAMNVWLDGDVYIGSVLSAKYDFYDVNGDKEANSQFCWYRGVSEDSLLPITGADGKEYTLTDNDKGMYIAVGVTAVSQNAPTKKDEETLSDCVIGPVTPTALNVKIKGNVVEGQTVVASYTYKHPHGLPEEGTIFKWISGDNVVGTNASYTIPSGSYGTTLVLEVTPRSKYAPHSGEGIKSSPIYIAKKSESWSSEVSGGSGGSGGGFMKPGVDIKPDIEVNTESSGKIYSDTTNHWAEKEIEKMSELGVVTGVGDRRFEPDRAVSRCEFITMIARLFNLKNTEVGRGFTDVAESDWYFEAVQAAYAEGIVNGYGNEFRPLLTISREEAAAMLINAYEKYIGDAKKSNIEFQDKQKISEWAIGTIEKAVGVGLLLGDDNYRINPLNNLSRAEAACVLGRLYDAKKGVSGK